MSVINTGYCEIVSPVGTGDCEFSTSDRKPDQDLAQLIATEVMHDIVEDALDIATQNIGDRMSKISTLDCMLDDKMFDDKEKKCELSKPSFKGVGDQLGNTKEIVTEESKSRHPVVEKKSRLTDLVKNSKQILAKYILNENVRHDNPEDDEKEKEVQVIDLSNEKDIDTPMKALKLDHLDTENQFEEKEVEDEDLMDVIQLEKESIGDTAENMKKTMTFPLAGSSSKTASLSSRYRTLKLTASELKKKKWNIGGKFLNYLKKHKNKKGSDDDNDDTDHKAEK